MTAVQASLIRPVTAGIVTVLVGFTSSAVIVLSGLKAVGASDAQAASGLLAVNVTMGLASIVLAASARVPITIAWSTPGAALLVTTGVVTGGWSAAVGAFLIVGALIVVTGLVPQLGRLIARIPKAVAQAMLAGILFQLCLGPVIGLAANPLEVAPVVVVWLVALRFLPRFAVPLAFLAAALVVAIHVALSGAGVAAASLSPSIEFTSPTFTVAALVGIALPLYFVTMASQNVPGVAIMSSLGFSVPWRRTMLVTGAGTLAGATAGGHAINLAAISAALSASSEAGDDTSRRWIASVTGGVLAILLGFAATGFGVLVGLAPAGVIAAVAGLALLGTFATSFKAALDEPGDQIPAAVTFVTAASGITILGISAAFWALVAGLAVRAVLRSRATPRAPVPAAEQPAPAGDER